MEKVICWFSCGVTSAIACYLAIQKYGVENCIVIYISIGTAHPDNERFIKECEKLYGCEIIRRTNKEKFLDQFDVIKKVRYINGVNGAPCTKKLKKDVRYEVEKEYETSLFQSNKIIHQVFGFEFSKKEINRAVRFSQQYPYSFPIFPLIENKMTKPNCMALLMQHGIKIPAMYDLGYQNNNCIGCVKGGKGYWNKIRVDFPDTFKKMMDAEAEIGNSCIKGTFLKDLNPKAGRHEKELMPDCGIFCEVEFADIIDSKTEKILSGELNII